jgi:hypothetical protein
MKLNGLVDAITPPSLSKYRKQFEKFKQNLNSGQNTPEQVREALNELLEQVAKLGAKSRILETEIQDFLCAMQEGEKRKQEEQKETLSEIVMRNIENRKHQRIISEMPHVGKQKGPYEL